VTATLRVRSIDGRFDPDPITRVVLTIAGIAVLWVALGSVGRHHMTPIAAILLFVAALAWILPDGATRKAATALAPALLMVAFALIMWHPPKDTVLDGAILGGITSLLAVGLVIVYRSNKIINFAQAEMGAVPANIAFLLIVGRHWNYFLGTASGLIAAVLLGVLVEFLFLRRFFNSPRLIATVATIGVQQILIVLSLFLPRWIGTTDQVLLPSELPWSFHLNTVEFSGNQILVMIVVPITLVLLMAFFRFSAIGTALRATAESADRAGTLGIPVRRLQSVLWAIVGVLAFITIFLRNGVVGLSITTALDPTVLLAALGAAVIGRMERLPTTVAAAIGLGIVSDTVFNAWGYDAAEAVVIAGIIAIALIAQGRVPGAARLKSAAISTWQSTREVRPIPAELRRERPVIAAQVAIAGIVAVIAVLIPVVFSENRVQQVGTMLIYAIIGIALVMLTGWAGQVSLGQMAFVGVSGVAAGWFATNFTNPIVGGTIPAMIIGGIVGALATLLVGLPTLRVRGFTFAVMSFAAALFKQQYLLNAGYSPFKQFLPQWGAQTANGFEQLPRPPVLSIKEHNIINLNTDTRFYWLMIVVLALVIFAARGLRKTRTGRVLIGVRENERAAEAYSISGARTLVLAFIITGFITGIAGALFQLQQQNTTPILYGTQASLVIFSMVVVGGLGSIGGAILGALYVFGASYWLPPDYSLLATGAGMLLVLMILPGGLGAALGDARDAGLRWYARRHNIRVPSLVADTLVAQPPPTVEEAAMAAAVAESAEHVEDFAEVRE
jgi:branched-chain amino acid transport system permease protein